jgi:hypothetical protein
MMPVPDRGVAHSVMPAADRGVMAVMAPATIAAASAIPIARARNIYMESTITKTECHGGYRIQKASKND